MRILTSLAALLAYSAVWAAPVELGTVGRTYPLPEGYQTESQLSELVKRQSEQNRSGLPNDAELEKLSAFSLKTKMKVGGAEFSKSLPIEENLFIVGTDTVSQEWIVKNKSQLMALKARGLIVQANHIDEVSAQLKAFPELKFGLANGDALSEEYAITHYPILLFKSEKK